MKTSARHGLTVLAALAVVAATVCFGSLAGAATVDVVVDPTENQPPVAEDDTLVLAVDADQGFVDVLENDHDPEEGPLTIVGKTDGEFGAVACVQEGCTYTPTPGVEFPGSDSFTYTIADDVQNTDTATVTVTRETTSQNTPPVAFDDQIVVDDGDPRSGSVDVLENDFDPDFDDTLTIDLEDSPAFGEAFCDGSLCSYEAGPDFPGSDFFTYTVSDGTASDIGTVNVSEAPQPADCPEVAAALDGGELVAGESWEECSSATANGTVGELTPILKPVGGTSVLLTSGDVSIAPGPNTSPGAGRNNATTARGAYDVSILAVELAVPEEDDCLSFDFVFGSEEHPEFVDFSFNDAFIAELDESTWLVNEESDISAPNNFAMDPEGRIISINSGFFTTQFVVEDSGMQYDGTTPKLIARTGVTPGAHTLFLSIFDAGDPILDSGVLIDNLQTYDAPEGECIAGASLPDDPGPTNPGPFEPDPFVPTDPTPPTEPTEPTEPTDPTDPPSEPTSPTEPTGPTTPAEPTSPSEPTEPTAPTSPAPVRPSSVISTPTSPAIVSTTGDFGSSEIAVTESPTDSTGGADEDTEDTEVLGDVTGVLRLSAPSAVPGGEVVFSGEGCEPGERVQLLVNGDQFDSIRADDDGGFVYAGPLPHELAIGQHELQARCSGITLSTIVDVVVTTSAGASASSAGVVLAFFLLLALVFTQGRGAMTHRPDDTDVDDDDLVGV